MRRILILIPLAGCASLKDFSKLDIDVSIQNPQISGNEASMPVYIRINNPYAVALRIVSVNMNIYWNGINIGTLTLSSPQAINAKGTTTLNLYLKSTPENIQKFQQLTQGTKLQISGYITVEPLKNLGAFQELFRYRININRTITL